jgi:hypothetical protein
MKPPIEDQIALLRASDRFLKEPSAENRRLFYDVLETVKRAERVQPSAARPGPRLWTAVAALLVFIVLISLGGIAALVTQSNEESLKREQTIVAIQQTNTSVISFVHATETSKAWTATSSPTVTPTNTETVTPSETPTPSTIPIIDVPGTQTAEAETSVAISSPKAIDQTDTAVAQPTANAFASETIPVLTAGAPSPAVDLSGSATALEQTNIVATLTLLPPGGSEQPVVTLPPVTVVAGGFTPEVATATKKSIPGTGFFEDVASGKAGPGSLALVALAALVLVGVIVAARRLRVRT